MERTEICQPPEFTGETIGEMYKNLIARAARISDVDDIIGDGYDIDRLRELVQADREGRCVVLPKEGILKKGDKVWYCDKETAEIESGTVVSAFYKNGKLESFSVDYDSGDFDEFVGSAFGTCFVKSCEAAEAAIVGTRVI